MGLLGVEGLSLGPRAVSCGWKSGPSPASACHVEGPRKPSLGPGSLPSASAASSTPLPAARCPPGSTCCQIFQKSQACTAPARGLCRLPSPAVVLGTLGQPPALSPREEKVACSGQVLCLGEHGAGLGAGMREGAGCLWGAGRGAPASPRRRELPAWRGPRGADAERTAGPSAGTLGSPGAPGLEDRGRWARGKWPPAPWLGGVPQARVPPPPPSSPLLSLVSVSAQSLGSQREGLG